MADVRFSEKLIKKESSPPACGHINMSHGRKLSKYNIPLNTQHVKRAYQLKN